MCIGYLFAVIAFVISGLIESYVADRCEIDTSLKQGSYYYQICAYPALDNTIWIIPYFFITCGEVCISISGLNFVYEEVGRRTKSSSTALWLLTSSLGSYITSRLYKKLSPALETDEKHLVTFVQFYYICAGIIALTIIPQAIITYYYVPKKNRASSHVEVEVDVAVKVE